MMQHFLKQRKRLERLKQLGIFKHSKYSLHLNKSAEPAQVEGSWLQRNATTIQNGPIRKTSRLALSLPLRILTATVLVLSLAATPLYAAAPPKMVVIMDDMNRSYLPIRLLNGFDGMSMSYDASSKQIHITKGDKEIILTTGSKTALVNQERVELPSAPFTEQGNTYVPIQLMKEQLGLAITWNQDASSVRIQSGEHKTTLPFIKGTSALSSSKPVESSARTFKVGSRSFSTQIVTVSLLHPKVQLDVALAGNTVGKVQDLKQIAKANQAVVAINGTFFDAYTTSSFKTPYGYIVSGGEVLKASSGDRRTIFMYDKNHLAELIPGLELGERFKQGTMEGALQAGPRLVTNGKVSIDVTKEGFKDPKILTGGGARSALGITKDHKLILLTTGGATIPQLAEIMKQAGAYQAMNLDGGASSGLYYNGKYLTTPGRQISNAIIVTTN